MQNETLGKIWEKLWPLILWFFDFCEMLREKFLLLINFLYGVAEKMLALGKEKYVLAKPVVLDFAQKNKIIAAVLGLVTLLLLFFWIKMLQHANQKELVWRKLWLSIVFILGPIGAAIYYFGRKRALEKEEYQHQKVALSFFSPMSKRPPK